jgi:hypothetical protein
LVKPSHAPRACTTIALADSLIVGVQTRIIASCDTLKRWVAHGLLLASQRDAGL